MAKLFRRRLPLLLSSLALAALAAGLLWWNRRSTGYTPGEKVEGLVDTLARDLPEGAPSVRFVDVTDAAGIDFRHFEGVRTGRLPEDMGSGVAAGDVDGDGWTDLCFVNAGPVGGPPARSRLYRNRGDGTYEDVSERAGFVEEGTGMAAAFLDADADGDLDLLVTRVGGLRLWRNLGGCAFEDMTEAAGLAGFDGFWTGIGVADYDRDERLDLYVCGYVRYDDALAGTGDQDQFGVAIPIRINPSVYPPERNLLLRGLEGGRFEEVGEAAGASDARGKGLGVLFTDLTGDGWPDLYVANDVSDNAYLVNRGDGTFQDRTAQALVGDYRGAMGLAAADFDNDLDTDLFITHWVAQENALYQAREVEGALLYLDVADRFGLGHTALKMVGWATGFFDLDHDGNLDLFVLNGSTIPLEADRARLSPQRSQLFWHGPGERRGHYFELGAGAGEFWGEEHVARGGALLDHDLDGDLDLAVVLHGERARLLAAQGLESTPGVRLRLRQPTGNRFAIGTRVELELGGERRLAVQDSQGSYLSQHSVGELDLATAGAGALDRLHVRWPDGVTESAGPFYAGTLVTWTRGTPPAITALPGLGSALRRPGTADAERKFFATRSAANAARLDGRLEEAAAAYRQALAQWSGHQDVLYYLGNTLFDLGREADALATWSALVAFEPGSNAGWMQIGRLRLPGGDPLLDDLDAAAAAFARCHAINGEESGPVVQLGLVALLRGDLPSARRELESAARLNPRSVEARYLLGKVAWEAGDRDGAERLLNEAHALARAGSPAGTSKSNEGDTRSGRAMVSAGAAEHGPLDGWRDLADRDTVDVASEYSE